MSSFRAIERLHSCVQPVRKLVARLRGDNTGVAAIEFALIAPIMFFMLVGTVELSQAITVDRRVTVVASTTADLVAREDKLKADQIKTFMDVIGVLLAPYDASSLRVTILSVGAQAKATPTSPDPTTPKKICWKYDHPTTVTSSYNVNDAYTLPAGIVDAGGSVIVADVSYTYTPLIFSYFIKSAFPLKERFYLKPRVSNFIPYDQNNTGAYQNRDAAGSCLWP
jgi:Flp pilus assembly protein TadG